MKTTTGKAIAALKALEEIRGQKISRVKAKELFMLRKELNDSNEFFMEQLQATCDRMGVEIINGSVTFGEDTEKRDQFLKEIAEIEDTETKISVRPVDLSGEDISISETFVEATDGFIIL